MESMMNSMWHLYVGNDRPPWAVALTRALVGAALLGASGFLLTWSQTDEVKLLIIAGLSPAVGHLLIRLGIEGTVDSGKHNLNLK